MKRYQRKQCESQAVRHVGKLLSARKEAQDWCFLWSVTTLKALPRPLALETGLCSASTHSTTF